MSIDPGAFQPLPLPDERAAAARAEAEALLAQANKMHGEAGAKAQRIVADARAEADRIRDVTRAETADRQKRDDNLDTWAARAVIAGAVGLTASGEYSLARMAGFDQSVAWLLPFVIDVYVIQAFRRHRDIVQAIALTIAANVTYHLADAGLFGVTARREPTWWLIALVASVASLILWRIHLMVRPPKPVKESRRERAERVEETAERAHDERVKEVPPALTETPSERAHEPQSERPAARSPERPAKPKSERGERARKQPKKSAPQSVTDRRRERVGALYDELGRRPEWTEIRDALVAAKLADKAVSRPTCQRVRDAVEAAEPKLAALGSDNVRALPGS